MTKRLDWRWGASSCILGGWENHTKESFAQYQRCGISYAELSVTKEEGLKQLDFFANPERIAGAAAENGLELTSFHLPFALDISFSNPDAEMRRHAVEVTKACILSAKRIGIPTMVLHPSRGYFELYDDREVLMKQCSTHVGEIYEFCESLGLTLALENMTGGGVCHVPQEMIRFLRAFPNMGVCFDTNHPVQLTPEAYLDELLNAGMQGRIRAVHVSDYDLQKEQHWMPGEGQINWPAVLHKLEELDFSGVFMYEVSRKCTLLQVSENFPRLITDTL